MRRMNVRRLVPLALVLAFIGTASADEVVLRGGSRLKGVVIDPGLLTPGDGAKSMPVKLLLPGGDVLTLRHGDVQDVSIATDAPAPGKYLRYVEPTTDTAGGLDVAVTHFVHPKGGARIDLVSAVHIADKAYFRDVQRWLEASDLVLYEGVKPKDMSVAEFAKGEQDDENAVRGMQRMVADWFDLAFQLEEIVYTRPHFVHADLTTEEFNGGGSAPEAKLPKGMEGLGDQLKMLKSMAPLMKGPMGKQLKKQLAKMMGTGNISGMLAAALPKATTELLLDRRNAVVIDRIKEHGAKTKGAISVFYGAGHMADLEKTLVETLGYRRAGSRWLRAWNID